MFDPDEYNSMAKRAPVATAGTHQGAHLPDAPGR